MIIPTAIEAHSERWNQFTWVAVVCLGWNSLSGYCQVTSTSTTMVFYDMRSMWVFPWNISKENASHNLKHHSDWFRAHLAVSTERVLFQKNKGCLCKSISPFTMGLYGSLQDFTIHVALITTLCVSLITSFQPPPSAWYKQVSLSWLPDNSKNALI